MNFLSDNTAAACPQVMQAVLAANEGAAQAYGADPWTRRLDAAFSLLFDTPVRAFAVATGTAANALGLAALVEPYEAVLAHEDAHIVADECGACEFYSGGSRLLLVRGADARLDVDEIAAALDANPLSVHTVRPAALSLTQATELGTIYSLDHLRGIGALARERGLKLHMDGARFANAFASIAADHPGVQPADMTWRAGVDVLSFGGTKNGALAAEAVVFFDPALATDFELRRKRGGHLLSKSRFVAAQLLALLEGDLWLRNARRANALAAQIGSAAGALRRHPVEANEIFLRLDAARRQALRAAGFQFHEWGPESQDVTRFVVSWNQPQSDVDALCTRLRAWS